MSQAQKTPFSRTLPLFAHRAALEEIKKRGDFLPGHVTAIDGQIVTVKFDIEGATFPGDLQMPLATSEYCRLPVQEGDLGVAIPSAVYLGGVSGLGGGTADLTLRGNLSALIWLPVANKAWSQVDPNALVLRGPNGVVLEDEDSQTTAVLTPDSFVVTAKTSITLQVGSHAIVIDSSGVTIDGKPFLTHKHTGVQTGGGVTGNVQ